MSEPWTLIATMIGGGGTLTLIAAILVHVTKGAIATAVTQAGNRELVRLKSDLETQLAEKKAAFTREFERERQQASLLLEQFKAELTFEAEVRRQAAVKKVEVLLRFVELGNGLIEKALVPILNVHGSSPNQFRETIEALNEYRGAFRDYEAFFDTDARREILRFADEVEGARNEYTERQKHGEASMTDASNRAEAARAQFFQTLRRELQIEKGEKVETKS
jgi:hypothetical protein